MNAWSMIIENSSFERLGWTLVHSVWEIALIGLLYALVGYESRPSVSEAAAYATGVVAVTVAFLAARRSRP